MYAAPGDDVTASVRPPAEVVADAAERMARHLQPGEVVAATPDAKLSMRLRREDRDARPVRLQEMAYHAVEAFDSVADRDGVVDLGVGWAHVSRKQDPRDRRGARRVRSRGVGARSRPAAARTAARTCASATRS